MIKLLFLEINSTPHIFSLIKEKGYPKDFDDIIPDDHGLKLSGAMAILEQFDFNLSVVACDIGMALLIDNNNDVELDEKKFEEICEETKNDLVEWFGDMAAEDDYKIFDEDQEDIE